MINQYISWDTIVFWKGNLYISIVFKRKYQGLRHSTVGVFFLCTQPTWVQLSALPMVPKALIIMIPNCRIWSKLLELLGVSPKMKNESNTYAVFKYHC